MPHVPRFDQLPPDDEIVERTYMSTALLPVILLLASRQKDRDLPTYIQ